jgi:voltage-gated potassium channel
MQRPGSGARSPRVHETTLPRPSPGDRDRPGRSGIPERMAEQFRRRAERAITRRRIFRYLAGAMLVLSVGAGFLAWLVDRRDFETLGDAMWWALVTVATVGYGDVVPETTWGRLIGSAVIVMGVTFLAILTATVTSYIVSAEQEARTAEEQLARAAEDAETRVLLREVVSRLVAVEGKLDRTDGAALHPAPSGASTPSDGPGPA